MNQVLTCTLVFQVFHTVTTVDDPVIRRLTKSQPDANVFATDTILATLMCCTRSVQLKTMLSHKNYDHLNLYFIRSVYSWDIVVQKIDGKIFLDKRDNTEFGK